MTESSKKQLEQAVVMAVREYGISTTLFRNTVGAAYTGLSSGATTAMLDRLERAKLITRQPNPNDRRSLLIKVNKDSVRTVGPLFAATRQAQDELVASYSTQELEVITDFFTRFTAVWEEGRRQLRNSA
jgi:DNA-binding MarR family transcriptional regulator